MKTVTLDDLIQSAKELDNSRAEPYEVQQKIKGVSERIVQAALSDTPIRIVTDYDCDGICSAYIADKTIRKINPNIDLDVICSDRRESYGVPRDLTAESGCLYIFLDMGSNELDYIKSNFGENSIIIDHHLIEGYDKIERFCQDPTLLNPHSFFDEHGRSAEYCATGLSFRVIEDSVVMLEHYEKDCNKCIKFLISALNSVPNGISLEDFLNEANQSHKFNFTLTETQNEENLNNEPCKRHTIVVTNKDSGEVLYSLGLAENLETQKLLPYIFNVTYSYFEGLADKPFKLNESGTINRFDTFDFKFKHTMEIMVGIGTVADIVNLADPLSRNRSFVKQALLDIDVADEKNTDYVIGYMLKKCGIGDTAITAKDIGFSVSPFINSASRMSELMGANGAMLMYKAITGDPSDVKTYTSIDKLFEVHKERKTLFKTLQNDEYYSFVESHLGGANKNDNVVIYEMPEYLPTGQRTPTSFCGILAGKLADATDKPAVCVVYNSEKGHYVGSGRSVEGIPNFTEYINYAVGDNKEKLQLVFGGHGQAFGISHLQDLSFFKYCLQSHQEELVKEKTEKTFLSLDLSTINSEETLHKILALEPLGNGFRIPPIVLKGIEIDRENPNTFKKTEIIEDGKLKKVVNPYWKDIKISTEDNNVISITDWNYSPVKYPQGKDGTIYVLATLDVNQFRDIHLQFNSKYDRDFTEKAKLRLTPNKDSTEISR